MAYRNAPALFYGWRDGDKYYLSLDPRGQARNEYASSGEALREASKRGRKIVWEDPKVVE